MSRTASSVRDIRSAEPPVELTVSRLIGTLIAAGGSALFWVLFLAYVGPLVGIALPGSALAIIGFAIAAFLGLVINMVPDERMGE